VGQNEDIDHGSVSDLLKELEHLHKKDVELTRDVMKALAPLVERQFNG
jgi:hypothetical protein